MNMSLKTLAGAAVAITMSVSAPFAANAQDYSFKFQSSDPAGNPNFIIQQEWAERVGTLTGGRISIEMLPVGSVVEHNETQDAIAAGILDGHITDTSYFSGKDPAFGLIANPVGAWSDPQEMFRFMEYGGGKELMNSLVEPYGLHFIGATTPGLEAFVSAVPLDGVDDLKGLKMRAPEGMVNEVFAAAGATPVNIPGSEVFTSLDKKVIEAADYTVFSTNQAQGLHDIAKHPVYPGFHSMPLVEVSMNKAKWDGLPADLQEILTVSVRDLAQDEVSQLVAKDMKAVAEARAKGDITIHNWSQEERNKFRAIATKQWAKVAERSENAKKVYDTLMEYLTSQGMI
ncbi:MULTISPECIES: TRAP transporter substrate-binding protein [Thalassospira]|uniref:TRAP transporter substrate-binding protein n=1 Tax=Thalassospira povalilytica TaxID=732237 RepID=A0A8I1M9U0_9PROT|nr:MULTISPECIES: TRAP transporter substrate-binding protein [Thalassospira]MEE3046126.1 TRAP transporter substrate-binding protein [Pseudomonadota bacterium]RCK20826.1 C4-dicarboxylate ABC transporter substrate-binding protein [Thalassospira profundimaris]KZB69341.1 C4-dicarboxylate ABC transporter substrate-binding protein [Thalassospira sp. MCCC 1A02491]MBN8198058.1 TRAP transporter substrate-binding protein [Thalassospira povalilytica]MCC4239021.1 TRAP transporter substrate-binding protein |tara:strand:+ start:2051 stop:3079 length:1029 start_codon:yes stop_codon:yes gene_type:complete|eukprot:TRINITY_DN4025_c0_g6_i2.p1 TRINITY_DN4025_c0_g6~~TRINITY_DN4025_c0_g6_i2.p1  ORF type:complete len:343 (+),score=83.33 TRINITY_DN4025_c0_g6_i2:718-1746(+)